MVRERGDGENLSKLKEFKQKFCEKCEDKSCLIISGTQGSRIFKENGHLILACVMLTQRGEN